jgi:two-component system OmpR family response regulator
VQILVVEDEIKMARIIRRGLEQESFAVDVALDGESALQQAAEREYDGVLLDVMLPSVDGFGVCSALREQGSGVPILMVSARDGIEDRLKAFEVGADDYLVKPFAFGELLERLRTLLGMPVAERIETLRVGDLTLDLRTRQVTLGSRRVELSDRELDLLDYMMRHPGEVLTRAKILENVWAAGREGGSNLVDVYVGSLRRKLRDPVYAPLIRTVRGVGYMIEAL